jgi:arylsulfatase A-like enzyme
MRQAPSSLILITVDCLRADHVGFLGYNRPTTPFLDSLAKESIVFRNAIAAGAPTYYSLPAILASRYPLALGRDVVGVAPDETTLPSVLKEHGFQTAAFVAANPYLSARFGYKQAFDCFRDFLEAGELEFSEEPSEHWLRGRANQTLSKMCHAVRGLGRAYDELYFQYCQRFGARPCEGLDSLRRFPSADLIVDHAIAWLNENSSGPFFLWLHLMDPHAPYYPKLKALELMKSGKLSAEEARYLNSFWNRNDIGADRLGRKLDQVVALYDAGIRWADTQIRRLTERLVELNIWNKCALAVTADHGEEFLDHGGRFHAPLKLTEELIRVPLLLRAPQIPKFLDISSPFGLIDLAPTVLDALGVPAPGSFRGHSRWEQVEKGETWDRPVFTECVHGCTNPLHSETRTAPRILAVRKGHYKLVLDFTSGSELLFDLDSDAAERKALSVTEAKTIRRELLGLAKKHLAESQKSRDFDRRLDSQLRDLRIEWAHPTANAN